MLHSLCKSRKLLNKPELISCSSLYPQGFPQLWGKRILADNGASPSFTFQVSSFKKKLVSHFACAWLRLIEIGRPCGLCSPFYSLPTPERCGLTNSAPRGAGAWVRSQERNASRC